MTGAGVLVVAKAPVAGRVKTRLAASVGAGAAAELAVAALLDTIDVCEGAFGVRRCTLALAGDLADAVHGDRIAERLAGWTVFPQEGDCFGERLEDAHRVASEALERPVVQVGMDTPQVTAPDLRRLADRVEDHDAVLAPAYDGGWWALGISDPSWVKGLGTVPMSTGHTWMDTRRLLESNGARVADGGTLRDVDHAEDADLVTADAPGTRFARRWNACRQQNGIAR